MPSNDWRVILTAPEAATESPVNMCITIDVLTVAVIKSTWHMATKAHKALYSAGMRVLLRKDKVVRGSFRKITYKGFTYIFR